MIYFLSWEECFSFRLSRQHAYVTNCTSRCREYSSTQICDVSGPRFSPEGEEVLQSGLRTGAQFPPGHDQNMGIPSPPLQPGLGQEYPLPLPPPDVDRDTLFPASQGQQRDPSPPPSTGHVTDRIQRGRYTSCVFMQENFLVKVHFEESHFTHLPATKLTTQTTRFSIMAPSFFPVAWIMKLDSCSRILKLSNYCFG